MTTTKLSADVFDRFAMRDGFLGFGYIGERRSALEAIATGEWPASAAADVAAADQAVLEAAASRGWDEDRLFDWANSKNGRWFADLALGCRDLAGARRYL